MNSQLLELFYKLKKFNTQFKNKKLRFVTNNSVYESNFFYTYLLHQCELIKENPETFFPGPRTYLRDLKEKSY